MKQEKLLHYHSLWLLIGWCLLCIVVYFSLAHKPPLDLPPYRYADKLGHVLAYAILMGWFAQLYVDMRQRAGILIGLIGMGVVLEFIQHWGGVRQWEVADMLANSSGAVLAYIMTYGRLGAILLLLERKIPLSRYKQD